jgi:hypothetical protein
MRQLPTFKGYAVDFKLQEFRKAVYGKALEFIPFSSLKGESLMKEFLKTPEGKKELDMQPQ